MANKLIKIEMNKVLDSNGGNDSGAKNNQTRQPIIWQAMLKQTTL